MDIFFFQAKKKRSKKVVGDYYRGCVPNPETLFGKRENKRLFSHCMDRRPRLFDYGFKQKQVLYFKSDNLVCFILMNSFRREGGLLPPHYETGEHRSPLRYDQKRVTKRKNSFQGDKNGRKSKNLGNKTICRSRRTGYSHDGVFQRLSVALSLVPQSRRDKPAKTACVFCQ